jgi:nucleotide-binding universal stress UspA family protein
VVQHASCSTLIVRDDPGAMTHSVLAIEAQEDADRLRGWLSAHRLVSSVSWSVMSVVPTPHVGDPTLAYGYAAWTEEMEKYAQTQVRETASVLGGIYQVSATQVVQGDPADQIAQAAKDAQLLVIGSHGRRGMERFLLGSVSHAVLHHVRCPVLVVR